MVARRFSVRLDQLPGCLLEDGFPGCGGFAASLLCGERPECRPDWASLFRACYPARLSFVCCVCSDAPVRRSQPPAACEPDASPSRSLPPPPAALPSFPPLTRASSHPPYRPPASQLSDLLQIASCSLCCGPSYPQVKLLDKMLHGQAKSVDQEVVVLSQVGTHPPTQPLPTCELTM